jgi:DNA-binding MarR family transcriptional regulator
VGLTEAGREMNTSLDRVFVESAEECFRGFSNQEMEQFASFLIRMKANLEGTCEAQARPGECE